eukprot:CAMPEP_0114990712 /NCGR_PEP_ID=MMETSP0216-20121206/10959_1 /TAXON_ID=223996 /ORGANISM="Protocruzia adherens, Strain Boccale" /LENGTH=585 /DNA_ID=CAMNT_0002353939 /DNA_START=49 /DNA_END=1806 /DNA_ORIENTATION=+
MAFFSPEVLSSFNALYQDPLTAVQDSSPITDSQKRPLDTLFKPSCWRLQKCNKDGIFMFTEAISQASADKNAGTPKDKLLKFINNSKLPIFLLGATSIAGNFKELYGSQYTMTSKRTTLFLRLLTLIAFIWMATQRKFNRKCRRALTTADSKTMKNFTKIRAKGIYAIDGYLLIGLLKQVTARKEIIPGVESVQKQGNNYKIKYYGSKRASPGDGFEETIKQDVYQESARCFYVVERDSSTKDIVRLFKIICLRQIEDGLQPLTAVDFIGRREGTERCFKQWAMNSPTFLQVMTRGAAMLSQFAACHDSIDLKKPLKGILRSDRSTGAGEDEEEDFKSTVSEDPRITKANTALANITVDPNMDKVRIDLSTDELKEQFENFKQRVQDKADELFDFMEADDWEVNGTENKVDMFKKFNTSTGCNCVKGSGIVKAPLTEILNTLTSYTEKKVYDRRFDFGEYVEAYPENLKLTHEHFKGQWPVSGRDFCILGGTVVRQDGRILIVGSSIESPKIPTVRKYVRGHLHIGGWMLEPLEDEEAVRCTYGQMTDLGGSIPSSFIAMLAKDQAQVVRGLRIALKKKGQLTEE